LVANPVIQASLQAEIDVVIGEDRLLTFYDCEHMPYMRCLIIETIRWGSSMPVDAPHWLSEDDYYKGFYLPVGSMIMANQRAMLHDSLVYPNPSVFSPDHF
ncbi:cytochrome P450, partial [Mycena rosella]